MSKKIKSINDFEVSTLEGLGQRTPRPNNLIIHLEKKMYDKEHKKEVEEIASKADATERKKLKNNIKDKTSLNYTFVGYLQSGIEPKKRNRLKESYNEVLDSSPSVAEWNYLPQKRRYEITISQEFPCFNFESYIFEAVVEQLHELVNSDLFSRNLVLVDGIYQNHSGDEYKLSLDELRNFIKIVDRIYTTPYFLIMDSAREEILAKYSTNNINTILYNTLLLNPDVLLPIIKEFVKSAKKWGWVYFIEYFNRFNGFNLGTIEKQGQLIYEI